MNDTIGIAEHASTAPSLRAQPLDPLSAVNMLAGLYFIQVWGFATAEHDTVLGTFLPLVAPGLVLISAIAVVMPRLHGIILFNALSFSAYYLVVSPIASNNQLTGFALCLVIIGAYSWVYFRKSDVESKSQALFDAIAGPGRWILPAMYFFGIYHKINVDFLDPTASCAVELYRSLAIHFGMADLRPLHYFAIYITFMVEGIAMIALFIPRLKRFGLMIGLPFHIVIGLTGYSFYKDFSTVVLILYALFLTPATYTAGVKSASRWVGSQQRACDLGRLFLIGGTTLYFIVGLALKDEPSLVPTHSGFILPFAVYAILFYLGAVTFLPGTRSSAVERIGAWPRWLLIFPVLYFLNGWSPYFGLKTEASIAMYSNLHIEGGRTNHLIHGQLPGSFGYQNDLVYPTASNAEWFSDYYVGPEKAMAKYELDRLLAHVPDLRVEFIHRGRNVDSAVDDWPNSFLSTGPFMRKFLIFKPIDFNRPKACTH